MSLFFVESWIGLGIMVALAVLAIGVARLPVGRLLHMSVPLIILLAFICICNMVTPGGLMTSLAYALRILLIFFFSYAVVFTTTSEALTHAFATLLAPLRILHVPLDDIAMVFTLALRFIPMMAEEADTLRRAQTARGARFEEGNPFARIMAWRVVLIPLVVGMYRRAGRIGTAMEARCYGLSGAPRTSAAHASVKRMTPESSRIRRTSLQARSFSGASWVALIIALGVCVTLAVCF